MRVVLILLLVLLVLATGLPLGAAMAHGCPTCHLSDGPTLPGACAAIIGFLVLILGALSRRTSVTEAHDPGTLLVITLERPPRQ